MKEIIEVETGFGSSEADTVVRIYATDLVRLARAMKGKEYLDLSITSGVRRIANIDMVNPEPAFGLLNDWSCACAACRPLPTQT